MNAAEPAQRAAGMTARALCTDGRYYDCPAYRFWRRPEPLLPRVA